jgi:hypothetical protein
VVETIFGKALLYRAFLSWEGAGERAAGRIVRKYYGEMKSA